jgi:hypothetical protein
MGADEQPYRRYLFTVRLWKEDIGHNQAEWRGLVQSAKDGERRAFRDWPDLIAFFVAKSKEIQNDEES